MKKNNEANETIQHVLKNFLNCQQKFNTPNKQLFQKII